MNRIAKTSIIVSAQLLVVGLFLFVSFTGQKESEKVVVVENTNLVKMADSVSELFLSQVPTIEEVDLDEEVVEELISSEEKEKVVEPVVEEVVEETPVVEEVVPVTPEVTYTDTSGYTVYNTYTGTLTGYGPNCSGCSGYTASGYNVNNTVTYTDSTFGEVRIVAADPSIPLYSIVRINNIPSLGTVTAIVLDRGGNVGFGRGTLFDLLFASESEAIPMSSNITFDMLRIGG